MTTHQPPGARPTVIEEIRELGWTSWATFPPPIPAIHDREAEDELVGAAWYGFWPTEPLASDDFFQALPRAIYEVLDCARACGFHPTIALLLRGLQELGIRGPHLEAAVRRLTECGTIAVDVDAAAHQVRSLAWRRKLARKLDHLRATLLASAFSDAEVETEIDEFVAVGAAQPHCSRTS